MMKLSVTMLAGAAVLALGACNTLDHDTSDAGVYSKQQMKERKAAKSAEVIRKKEHTHPDGTVHIHKGGKQPHVHDGSTINMYDQEGVFFESDNDYARESTLNDLSEDDAEIIQWRKEHRMMKKMEAKQQQVKPKHHDSGLIRVPLPGTQ